ncbi:hypothetical protein EVAR_67895_1 [Eumeta japonica]|uniref:Uncharacterized protein n=1 Tax=Eumeta variegata TaxID=151549 RepID=A0A4C1YVG6_EUMVA|nr:hypothetical protein EVAR_67895_1 [Eumeta japonica]
MKRVIGELSASIGRRRRAEEMELLNRPIEHEMTRRMGRYCLMEYCLTSHAPAPAYGPSEEIEELRNKYRLPDESRVHNLLRRLALRVTRLPFERPRVLCPIPR